MRAFFNSIQWALFCNDDGGIYGERDDEWVALGNTKQNTWTAFRWWLRNPFHNLFWHVIDWPRERAFVLVDNDGAFYYREPDMWLESDHYQITLAPLFIGWRKGGWQGYFGWRDKDGVFGLSFLRRAKY